MDRKITSLGLFFCFLYGCFGAEYVTVSNDIKVKPTDAAHSVNVVLNCTGSRSDLSFYIKNRMQWSFEKLDGGVKKISLGFYLVPELASSTKYKIAYGEKPNGYYYSLEISGVTHEDAGIYRCSLLDEANAVTDSKDVTVTVVNPVEELTLELHGPGHNLVASSISPIMDDTHPVEITPGEYMLHCVAKGSNPAAFIHMHINEDQPYAVVTQEKAVASGMIKYTVTGVVSSFNLNAKTAPQALVCSANIDGDFYPNKNVGIAVMVQVDKPMVHCANATAQLGDRHAKLMCNVTAEGSNDALFCDKVSWYLGNIQQFIRSDERWNDPTKVYDILESSCKKETDGLKVNLELYTVKAELFKETYFLVYGVGENAHRHPVILYDVTVVGGSAVLSLSLCLLGLVAVQHVLKRLAEL